MKKSKKEKVRIVDLIKLTYKETKRSSLLVYLILRFLVNDIPFQTFQCKQGRVCRL